MKWFSFKKKCSCCIAHKLFHKQKTKVQKLLAKIWLKNKKILARVGPYNPSS